MLGMSYTGSLSFWKMKPKLIEVVPCLVKRPKGVKLCLYIYLIFFQLPPFCSLVNMGVREAVFV